MPKVSQLYKLGSQQGKEEPLPWLHTLALLPPVCSAPLPGSSWPAPALSGSIPSAMDGCPEARRRGWGLIGHPQVPEASLELGKVWLWPRPKTLSLPEAEGPHEPHNALCLGKEAAGSSLAFRLGFKP